MEYRISAELKLYLIAWTTLLLTALFLAIRDRDKFPIFHHSYVRFITERWKIWTFIIATAVISITAPFSGDATWDVANSIIISFMTYFFAPWSIAVLFKSIRSRQLNSKFWAALIFMFIPCWTYDLYILLRDGFYPPTWASNIPVTFGITVLAGLFWNVCFRDDVGLTFAFKDQNWPVVGKTPFKKILWPCFLLSIPVFTSVGWFVYMDLMGY